MKLALGTAQFGMNYGITNQQGKVPLAEVKHILQLAQQAGIDTLDSALAYGESQQILAQTGLLQEFSFISKVQLNHPQSLRAQVAAIQTQTQLSQLAGVLIHDADAHPLALTVAGLEELACLQQEFGIEKIGISSYEPTTLFSVLPEAPCSLVQFPANLFDQRFLQPAVVGLCERYQVTCHARSLFLQGLLLAEQSALPGQFSLFQPMFAARDAMALRYNIDLPTLCLSMITAAPHIERWVIGTCHSSQLRQILRQYTHQHEVSELNTLQSTELQLIRPDYW